MKFNAARQPFSLAVSGAGLLSALFAARYFIAPYPFEIPAAGGTPLADALTRFSATHPVWSAAAVLGLIVWICYILLQLTVRYASATSRNYLPVPVFVIASCGMAVSGQALASFAAAYLLALATRQFISAFRKDYRFEEAFRGGFYLGGIALLYAPAVVLLLMIPLVMNLYRRSARELAVGLIGAAIPFTGAWFVLWAGGQSVGYFFTRFWSSLTHRGFVMPPQIPEPMLVCAVLAAFIVLTAIAWYLGNRTGMRTRQRKVMGHTTLLFAFLAASLAVPGSSLTLVPILSVPAAMAIPYAFTGRHAAVSTVSYSLLIAAVLVLNFLRLFGVRFL